MFTQCPECKTVYEVAPADLAVAAGLVRCGECSQTFSALRSLAETPLDFETQDVPEDSEDVTASAETAAKTDAETAADTGAEDNTDDEAGADEGETDAGAVAAVIATATALATQPADTQSSGDDEADAPASDDEQDDSDAGSEPDDDGGSEEASIDDAATIAEDDSVDLDDETADDETADDDDREGGDEIVLDEFYEPPGSDDEEPIDDEEDWDPDDIAAQEQADDAAESEPVDESALFSLPVPELLATGIVPPATVPEKLEGGEAAIDPFALDAREPGLVDDAQPEMAAIAPASEPAMRRNDAVDAEDARDLSDYLRAPRPGRLVAAGWTGGSVLLALALFLQVLHHNRGDLVLHQRFGPAIKSLYKAIGLEARPNWRVDDYKIVGQARLIELPPEQTGQPPGEYRFVAIIANRADRPQPPPMVRITLRDRWGDPQGVRNFAPPEYLTDRSMVEQLLEPGQRLRVVLNLLGPGAEIDGFDFDMCLPDTQGQLRCSSEPAG